MDSVRLPNVLEFGTDLGAEIIIDDGDDDDMDDDDDIDDDLDDIFGSASTLSCAVALIVVLAF